MGNDQIGDPINNEAPDQLTIPPEEEEWEIQDNEPATVLGTISDLFNDNTEELNNEQSESDSEEIPERKSAVVTRASVGIYKPNPKYALAITLTEISYPKISKICPHDSKVERRDEN